MTDSQWSSVYATVSCHKHIVTSGTKIRRLPLQTVISITLVVKRGQSGGEKEQESPEVPEVLAEKEESCCIMDFLGPAAPQSTLHTAHCTMLPVSLTDESLPPSFPTATHSRLRPCSTPCLQIAPFSPTALLLLVRHFSHFNSIVLTSVPAP